MADGGQDLFTTPTSSGSPTAVRTRPDSSSAGPRPAPGSGRYPGVYFLFLMDQEEETLQVVRRSALLAATAFLPLMTGIMYLISLQALRPIRAAREASERTSRATWPSG